MLIEEKRIYSEAIGEYVAYRELKKLGYTIDTEWLKYKNNQGSDLVMKSPEGKILFVEVKGGVNVHGPGNLGKIKIRDRNTGIDIQVRQGDKKYLLDRVNKGIERAKKINDYEAIEYWESLKIEIQGGNIESIGIFVNTKSGDVKMYNILDEMNYIELERTRLMEILNIKNNINGDK